jgi:dUTP pyrophosphatase
MVVNDFNAAVDRLDAVKSDVNELNHANVKFAKVRKGSVIPSKRNEDMGLDIYACFDEDYIVIYPHETKLIPTGIASSCDENYGFVLKERGSTGSKGIALRCGVIDSGYRNEWFVGLTNTTRKTMFISKLSEADTLNKYYSEAKSKLFVKIKKFFARTMVYPYSKAIAQTLVVPVPKLNIQEVSYEELKEIKSERGMGALGSSNK